MAASERPVRLTVTAELRQSRWTVGFRALFALPFMVWLGVWAIGAFFVAFVNWVATLVAGKSPQPLHDSLARFVRYSVHALAFLNLAAEPFPGFRGRTAYPVDVEIEPPARQSRWTVGLRAVLALPALLLVLVLCGGGSSFYNLLLEGRRGSSGLAVIGVAALLGWFSAMARGRMPRGLRDLIAYALSYGAQFWAYLLLLTARYPSSDPQTALGSLPTRFDPVRLGVGDELRRSRLTVFFRLPLAFPHLVWLSLWGILAFFAAIASWVATLVHGTSPRRLHRFLAAFVRYGLQVNAFLYLVGNPFPGFVGAEGTYPLELWIADRERQSRWTVLFRLILALPALLLVTAFGSLLTVVAFLGWFAALATGRMPLGLRNAGALALRYTAQAYAYLLLVTAAYPYSGPCQESPPALPAPGPRPALLTSQPA
jgi:Domain of unknown function (DUF4389)